MNSTWYNVAVVLLWLATMTWLISQKVLPALLVGDPPSYETIIEARRGEQIAGWSMSVNGGTNQGQRQSVGWAINTTSCTPDGVTQIRSLVHFSELPLEELIPDWLQVNLVGGTGLSGTLEMEAKSNLVFDSFQQLSGFQSSLGFPPLDDTIRVNGALEGTQLKLSIQSGDFTYETETLLPRKSLLSDTLTPQTQMPGLREGQTWNIEVYSPFRPPNDPVEILQASVEGIEPIVWGGEVVNAHLVAYRNDPGAGGRGSRTPRGRLWVRRDGTVLMQEVTLFNSAMRFVRLEESEAAGLTDGLSEKSRQWWHANAVGEHDSIR